MKSRFMFRVLVLAVALVIPALAGCQPPDTSPSPGLGDPYPAPLNDPTISVLSPDLQPWLGFHPATVVKDERKPMNVEIPMRSLSNEAYNIDYRILFYDKNGLTLEPVMGWTPKRLYPKQTERLSAKAMSIEAETYRIEVKWGK